ncbi:DUF2946 family protein [Burkholderia thailandensis]|uniref:DUF2946 domain-containing protein n=1 Tax=Burkholderia thailandensis (strain ATCC 700388 / DSM 13276 / CCUG 48851 / CIP 106301 / E264) TaxID=271848 RepID=Q2T0T8_BURTA|nr:DUF2946 family protein [Burkholderia thailandensis]ABC39210.1 conserved hypothetical protein [Burkholderia thailandensis E264]AHI73792.1 hypothetical protein BTQ_673 [Burkholderia thailandensis 2002721723]AHI79738.1 hypothetical protein BTJ_1771 [Burkholderia thailandensis E444]AIC88366.1 hypothetical protein BTRA_3361 [Burkholderia thailandensis USAMRU Malaysia \
MDDIVKQALAKWPNVPHCTGWLLLDRRGGWRMRDDAAQAAGALGSPVRHPALVDFIARNYERDEDGQWFFQNGPQRVYVELAYTPWIVRLAAAPAGGEPARVALTDHTGRAFEPARAWLDDAGGVLFADRSTPPRVAALHDHDLARFADCAELDDDGAHGVLHLGGGVDLPLEPIRRDDVARRFGFVASPAARAGRQTKDGKPAD